MNAPPSNGLAKKSLAPSFIALTANGMSPRAVIKMAYAHCADRRDAKGQMSLFTADTHFVVFMNAKDGKPSMELRSRDALAPVFADLNKYDATTHFIWTEHDLLVDRR
jgi:hypothetical protein